LNWQKKSLAKTVGFENTSTWKTFQIWRRKMEFDIAHHTILLVISGSHAYGMARPESDIDVRGVAIPPVSYFHGYLRSFEQYEGQIPRDAKFDPRCAASFGNCLKMRINRPIPEDEKIDSVIYDLRKFIRLCADGNPNLHDILWADESCWIWATPLAEQLVENRDLFMSTKVRWSYSGYAMSQLKRIRCHREHLLHPPSHKPTRADFGLPEHTVMPRDQLMAAESLVSRKMEEWLGSKEELPKDILLEMRQRMTLAIRDIWSALATDNKVAPPFTEDDDLDDGRIRRAAGKLLGYDSNFLELLDRERSYRSKMTQWQQYQEWKINRNPARAEIEARFGYDCHSADTQFLTNSGWKYFDDVSTHDLLATVYVGRDMGHRHFGTVEYQAPLERFDGTFTGNLYKFNGFHTDVLVTPNHRMFYRQVSRHNGETYNTVMEEASRLPDTFDFLCTIRPRIKRYSTKTEFTGLPIDANVFLQLMGWYLSDGTSGTRQNKEDIVIKDIRISQKKNGKLCADLMRFQNKFGTIAHSSLYEYPRKNASGETIIEMILSVRHPVLRERIVSECGRTVQKRIPRWIFGLSQRMMSILFDAMCKGDGTVRNTSFHSLIYYSSLENLADDVNELAFHCGWETSKWGPYANPTSLNPNSIMFQIHVNKNVKQFQRLLRSQNIKKISVVDHRIVCFMVPNGTLVTRRHGRIGIHGNSKHAAHLVRLMRQAKEILETGKVIVKRPDADELLAIRNGAWTYEQLIEWAEQQDKELDEFYQSGKSPLPKKPDHVKLDALCCRMVEETLR
jgi:predicted nucleotidyltransferase